MIKDFFMVNKGKVRREIIRFRIINGPMAGKIVERKCSMKHRNTWPKTLVAGNPTPFRIVRQVEKDFYEVEQTGLC